MNTRITAFSIILGCVAAIFGVACNSNTGASEKISVDKDITIAIYSTINIAEATDTVSPCLLKENVHISELHYDSDEDSFTMLFYFSDTVQYAEITKNNLDKRIAISVNGQVVSTPVVKMVLDNGACSVALDRAQMVALFPDVNVHAF